MVDDLLTSMSPTTHKRLIITEWLKYILVVLVLYCRWLGDVYTVSGSDVLSICITLTMRVNGDLAIWLVALWHTNRASNAERHLRRSE